MKKRLSLLSLLLVCTMAAMAQAIKIGSLYYNLDAHYSTAEVKEDPDLTKYSGAIEIPSKVALNENYYSVTYIGPWAFYECPELTSIKIPNSITGIGEYSFQGCTGLTELEIPSSVTTLYGSFFGCTGLKNVTLPNTLTSIGYQTFSNCTGLKSIEIPNSVTTIDGAFIGCAGLKSIEIPNSVTTLNNEAFKDCTGLTNVKISNSVQEIGVRVFEGCTGLTSIEIPNSVTSIGYGTFSGCTGLTSIEIPNSVTSIGFGAFYECAGLTSITMQSATPPTTDDGLFYGCSNLETIYVPAGAVEAYNVTPWCWYTLVEQVEIINPMLVDGLYYNVDVENKTAEVVAAPNDTKYSGDIVVPASISINGIEFAVTTIGEYAFQGCSGLTSIEIPNSVTSIGEYAFEGCSGLTSIEIPNSVTSIGEFAFRNCDGLTSIEIPNSVTSIGDYAFYSCSGLTSIEIPSSVTSIRNNTFECCFRLTSIEIPSSVTSIGSYAFSACSGLTSIEIPSSVTSIGYGAFSECSGLTSIEIPNSVTSIGERAFFNCSRLTSIVVEEGNSYYDSRENCNAIIETASNKLIAGCQNTVIPNSVTEIGEFAFYSCDGLTSIEIPNSVTTIGEYAFEGCSDLTSIEIPNSVTSIERSAFAYCTSLDSIYIPSQVSEIGIWVFAHCDSLSTIIVAPDNSIFDSRDNCNGIIETNTNTFILGCKTSKIPDSITGIADYAFDDCSLLTTLTIPSSVSYIGSRAFYNCDGLTSIEIPNSVTEIGEDAFGGCSGLTSITMQRATPPTVGANSFSECSKLETIYVPAGAAEAYNVAPWNAYNIVELVKIINPMLVDGLYYNVDVENKTAEVVAGPNDTKYSGDIAIPASISINGIEFAVTSIGYGAFSSCTGLTSIEIPNSVTSIGLFAFYNCSGLTSIEIPNSVTSIRNNIFPGCSGLTSIVVAADNPVYDSRENCNAIIETTTNRLVQGCKETVIPASVTLIGNYAFYGCSVLTSIEIPASVTSIGNWAFYGCSGLTSIEIPASVTSIGVDAFDACSGLTSIVVAADNPVYDSRENCNAIIETTTNRLLRGCNTTIIPSSVTSIESYAFSACSGLTSIEIPNSVTSIGVSAFSNCSGLTSIEIPNSVTWIGDNAFWNCSGLTSITMQTATPPGTSSDISGGFSSLSIIYVPAGAFEAYNVAPWNNYLIIDNRELYEELQAKCEALKDLNCFLPEAAPIGFSDHGLLVSESQLSTNKQEKTEGPIADLLDGDVDTFFHSTWSETNSDGAFAYIETDLGTMVDNLVIRYARRTKLGQRNDAPTSIRLLGEEPSAPGEWTDLGVYTLSCDKICFDRLDFGASLTISLPKKYQHLRFQVEETVDGAITNGNQFFNISEFGVWDCAPYLDVISHFSAEQVAEVEAVSMAAAEELNSGRVTQATIDRLDAILALMNGFVELTDGMAYTQAEAMEAYRITYTREFKNTQWQSWYVPFDMDYNDVSDEYTVACLNDIHEYDDDEDGILDRWTMEVLMLRPGETIYANLPYVIRAKAVGEKQFVVDNTTLYPADEQSMDCSSMRMLYTFRGVYSPLEAQVLRDNGWLAMGGGRLVTPTVNSTLKANRWYMESTPRGGYATQYEAPKRIELVVVDENGEVTGIEELPLTEDKNAVWPADVYDLNGRLVKAQAKNLNELPKGVYIVRGEKIVK